MALCARKGTVVLVLTLSCLCWWGCATSSSISVSPGTITIGQTKSLTVSCNAAGNLPNMPILVSLTLLASDTGAEGQFLPIATVSAVIPFTTFPTVLGGAGAATFHPRGPSGMQVTWANPGVKVARVYRCDVMGLDARWFYSTLSDTVAVSYKNSAPDPMSAIAAPVVAGDAPTVHPGIIDELSERVKNLAIKVNSIESMAASSALQMNKRFAEIENNIKSNMAGIEELKISAISASISSGNARPPASSSSSLAVRTMQTQMRRLENSYDQISKSSADTKTRLNNLTKAFEELATMGKEATLELADELEELNVKMMESSRIRSYPVTRAPAASSWGRSQAGSGDCCAAVNQLQASVEAITEADDSLLKRVDKLILWTSAVRDSEFEVSEIYEGKQYFLTKEGVTFDLNDAHWSCMRFGGYLVEVDDEAELEFLIAFASNYVKVNRIYTGANDMDDEKTWVFRFSQRPVQFFKWGRGQPDNRRRMEDCAYINADDGLMYDGYCEMRGDHSKFICEVPS